MALNVGALGAAINEALRTADEQTAPAAVKTAKSKQTRQRVAFAKAIAEQVIKHLHEHAEVVMPDHDPFRTGPAPGPGPHAHPIPAPLRHKHGKII